MAELKLPGWRVKDWLRVKSISIVRPFLRYAMAEERRTGSGRVSFAQGVTVPVEWRRLRPRRLDRLWGGRLGFKSVL